MNTDRSISVTGSNPFLIFFYKLEDSLGVIDKAAAVNINSVCAAFAEEPRTPN